MDELNGEETRIREEKEEAERQRQEKIQDQARIAKEQREQRILLQEEEKSYRDENIAHAKEWMDQAKKALTNIEEELEFYNFKLEIKKSNTESLEDEQLLEQNRMEIEETTQAIRDIQMNLGFERQYYQEAVNSYQRFVNEDNEIRSRQNFENLNEAL